MFCRKAMLPFGSHQAPLYRGSRQKRLKGQRHSHRQKVCSIVSAQPLHLFKALAYMKVVYNSDFAQSYPFERNIGPHVLWTPVLLSQVVLAHDVYVCLERPSQTLSPPKTSKIADYQKHFRIHTMDVRTACVTTSRPLCTRRIRHIWTSWANSSFILLPTMLGEVVSAVSVARPQCTGIPHWQENATP